jgi:hypothetical protein
MHVDELKAEDSRLLRFISESETGASYKVFKHALSSTFALFEGVQRHRSWEMGAFMVK